MIKLILVLIVSCISISDACRFPQRTNEELYCDSGFAGIITVATTEFSCGLYNLNRCYGINNVQQINGASINPIIIQTGLDSAGCGVELTQGNTYFIASNVVDPYVVGLYTYELYDDWTGLSPSDRVTAAQVYQAMVCPSDLPIKITPVKKPIKTLPTTGPVRTIAS